MVGLCVASWLFVGGSTTRILVSITAVDGVCRLVCKCGLSGACYKLISPGPGKKKKTLVIGLTGGICAGKSTVSEHLKLLGATIIDTDKLAHELYLPGKEAYDVVVKEWGSRIVSDDKTINRRVLGGIVFKDPAEMAKLNGIMWPRVQARCLELIEEHRRAGAKVVFVENAILFQSGMETIMDAIWVVYVSKEVAKVRLMERNKLTEEEALARIASQPDPDSLKERGTVVIGTDRPVEETREEVAHIYNQLLQ
ncbi:dephospho-CoA kinase [Pelomyxa schiedti]|nr:dephospho-CoA kinase [Pelomyxa schiedti]